MSAVGNMNFHSDLKLKKKPPQSLSVEMIEDMIAPRTDDPQEVRRFKDQNQASIRAIYPDLQKASEIEFPVMIGGLFLRKITPDHTLNFGLASLRVVTDEFVNHMVDALQDQSANTIDNFSFHGIGTGSTNDPAVGDSALESELSTEYDPDNTRASDSQGEGSSANIYQAVGTNSVDASVGIEEHGLFNVQTPGDSGELLMDRHTFSVINLSAGESLESTYELTINSGG